MATIFVTGPTGVLGRVTIPRLLAAGHRVRALSRSDANDAAIRAMSAEPVRAELFDVPSLAAALAGADAILHLATHIPTSGEMRRRDAWHENDRIRADGTRNLVDAGLRAGVGVVVYPSFAYVYPDSGDAWIDAEATPVDPVEIVRSTIAAEEEVARFVRHGAESGRRGVSLRLGGLYGVDLSSAQELVAMARRGISPFGGSPRAFAPSLWIDDAATALLAAVERAPSGTYDVVDNEPLRHGELNDLLAASVGRPRLVTLPLWLLRLAAGPAAEAMSRSLRISNRRFQEAAGWAPAMPDAHEGFARVATRLAPATRPRMPLGVAAGLWLLFLFGLLAGLAQQFAPRAFYDQFPGFGMAWVSTDGPYNEHLLRDLGGMNLAFAVVILFAILRPSPGLTRAVALGVLVAQAPHFAYHAAHLALLPTLLDQVLQTASLSLLLLLAAYVFLRAGGIRAAVDAARPKQPLDREEPASRRRLIAAAR